MNAILVKTLSATDTKGLRYKASTPNGQSLTINFNSELDYKDNMALAAQLLATELNWSYEFYGATLNPDAMVFVPVNGYHNFKV